MDLVVDVVTPVIAGVAAVAALGSWRASARSNRNRRRPAAIEQGRRRDEMTSEFEITCKERGTAADSADVHVELKPGELDRLDEVTIRILDETGREH